MTNADKYGRKKAVEKKGAAKKKEFKKKVATRNKKAAKNRSNKQVFQSINGDCVLLVELANAPSGLTFGKLIRGNAVDASKQIERLLSPRGSKVAAMKEGEGNAKKKNCLDLAKLGVHGTDARTLLNSGATYNVISRGFYERLKMDPHAMDPSSNVRKNHLREG